MGSFVDEFTGSKAIDLAGGILGAAVQAGTGAATDAGKKLVDEVGGRTGLAVSNIGPDAAAGLTANRGVGTPSPGNNSARNIASDSGGIMGWLTANWKLAGGIAAGCAAAWYFLRKKKR